MDSAKIYKDERNRKIAVVLWFFILVALVAPFIVDIFQIPVKLPAGFIMGIWPLMIGAAAIYSTVLYYLASKSGDRKKLRASARALFIMSLIMLVFIVVVWVEANIELADYLMKNNLYGTSGASGPAMAVGFTLAPISMAVIAGFLSFLIGSIKLWMRARR